MPFRDIVGHRRLIDLARAVDPERRASAQPDLRRPGTASASDVRARGRSGAQLPRPRQLTGSDAGRCTAGSTRAACAPSCTRIARGVHPDVIVVVPGDSGSIKIEQVRDIVDRAAYRPFEGRRRVVIIDEADALVPAAQNALLKTLEEPPPSSVFMLVTSRPDTLLPTVRRDARAPVSAARRFAAVPRRGSEMRVARGAATPTAASDTRSAARCGRGARRGRASSRRRQRMRAALECTGGRRRRERP